MLRNRWIQSLLIVMLMALCVHFFGNVDLPKPYSPNLWPDNRRIFFHETTGRRDLNARQSCAVESAAKNNPDRPVQLFLQTDHIEDSGVFIQVLRSYSNVQLISINATEYFANTPLNDWYTEGKWKTSPHSKEHLSDYIRMLSIYKGGGLYMDLDFVTIKPLFPELLWNFVPSEHDDYLTGSTLHLEHGHRLIKYILSRLASDYRPDVWAHHGPQLVTDIVQEHCNPCEDLTVFPSLYFYPIHFSEWKHYFRNDTWPKLWRQVKSAFALHVWNKLSNEFPVIKGTNQIYARMAAVHCPRTYIAAEDAF